MKLVEFDTSDKKLAPPRIKKLGSRGRINIYIVNGDYIRTNWDDAFEQWGIHADWEWIPENEIWIASTVPTEDLPILIAKLLFLHTLASRGVKMQIAVEKAKSLTRALKHKALGGHKTDQFGGEPSQVYIRTWLVANGITIIIVDGNLVRKLFDESFFEAGTDLSCQYIPENQIWIETEVTAEERPYVLLQQLIEREDMAKGENFLTAHRKATIKEYECRQVPQHLGPALEQLGVNSSELNR